MSTQAGDDDKNRGRVFRDTGLKLASELDKAMMGLALALFAGSAALLGTPSICTWDGGCFLITMVLSGLSATGSAAHMNLLAKYFLGAAAILDGVASLPGPFGDEAPAQDRVERLRREAVRVFRGTTKVLIAAAVFGFGGVLTHNWHAVVGAGKVYLAWMAGIGVFMVGLLIGLAIGRRVPKNP